MSYIITIVPLYITKPTKKVTKIYKKEELPSFIELVSEDFDFVFRNAIKASRGKNAKNKDAFVFNSDIAYNTTKLIMDIVNKTYQVSAYTKFTITDPKERLIYAPAHRDKILQLMLNDYARDIVNRYFISDSYASIINKGVERAVKKIQKNMRAAKRKWKNLYTLKLDIRKFFYTINREILKEILKKYFPDEDTLYFFLAITNSAKVVGDIGLPLGNSISQLSANIYLNELDQYLKRQFGLKYYVRYMDDIFIQVESKEKAKEILKAADKFVKEKLKLELNKDKSIYFPVNQGISGLGFKIYTTHLKLSDRSKKSLRKILLEKDINKFTQRFCSWVGIALNAECFSYIKTAIEKAPISEQERLEKKTIIIESIKKISKTKNREITYNINNI